MSLTDLMHCKQNTEEKLIEFIGRFKYLYTQISYLVPDIDIQHFFSNLQKDIRDKILLTKFTSFQQLCVVLHHYQLQVSQFESNIPMALVPVDKSDVAPNPNKFQKPKNYVKINKQENVVADQVVAAPNNATSVSTIFLLNHMFNPLSESLHSIMSKFLTSNMITLPPVDLFYFL